jgi:DNA-binding GntR family transcriptional regulator
MSTQLQENESRAVLRRPMKDEVYGVLYQRILAGEYAAGAWLRQEEIASQLGVSMTPVREALDLLVSSGLAERVPYRGVRILSPAGAEILHSYTMRLLLESAAAHAAALRISDGEIVALERLLEQCRQLTRLEDIPQERALSRELHSAVGAAAGNPLLDKMYFMVLNTFPDWLLYEHLFRHPELLEDSMRAEYREHRLLVEALAAHQPELAVRRTIEHVMNRGRELELYLGIPAQSLHAAEAQVLPLIAQSCLPHKQYEKELP